MGNAGDIRIEFHKDQDDLVITVRDNGNQPGKLMTAQHGNGKGLELTRERLVTIGALTDLESPTFEIDRTPPYTTTTFQFKNWLA